jgi:serine/alanine racemase
LTVHILNSALVFLFPQYAYDMVRTGTAMYGLPSFDGGRLHPILRICAHVFDVRVISDDAPLCYESHMDKPHDGCRRIARIMLGYWDSPLLLTQKEIRILIRGRLFPLADDICMDNLAVDVTGAEDIAIGDEAVLLGEGGVSLAETMERTGISVARSEWLCMTAGRLEKVIL